MAVWQGFLQHPVLFWWQHRSRVGCGSIPFGGSWGQQAGWVLKGPSVGGHSKRALVFGAGGHGMHQPGQHVSQLGHGIEQ
eukprot:9728477-Ditylum_brightwellii.AAC.1